MKNSIVSKGMATVGSLAIAVTAVTAYIVFTQSSQTLIDQSKRQLNHNADVLVLKTAWFMDDVMRDINFMDKSPALQHFLEASKSDNSELRQMALRDLETTFEGLLHSNPQYFQARIIGVENNGKELLRIERKADAVRKVPQDLLQEKGDMTYFKETVTLSPQSFYYSEFNLNKEHGKISHPKTPTIRAAAPVYANGKVFGIIILNVDVSMMFHSLRSLLDNDLQLYVSNHQEELIFLPDTSKAFAFEYNKSLTLTDAFGGSGVATLNQAMEVRNKATKENDLMLSKKVFTDSGIPDLTLSIAAPVNVVLAPFYSARQRTLIVIGIAIILFIILLVYYSRVAQQRLAQITEALTSFSFDGKRKQLPVDRDDEVGELSRAFESMEQKLHQQFKELEQAKDVAQKANESKEEFIATMTHEIRNPLQSILSMVRVLNNNDVSEKNRPMVETLRFSAENLKALVSNILDYTKIAKGEVDLKKERFSPSVLAENIIKSANPMAMRKGIDLRLKNDMPAEQTFVGDETRLYQVLNNLISNAIKFTEKGFVELDISMNEKELTFLVKDSGMGIATADLDNIFNRFYSKDPEHDNKSAGLGLSISRHLVQQMGGEITVESIEGGGSEFKVMLPVATDGEIHTKEEETPTFSESENLLVLEDVVSQQAFYEFLAEKNKWSIHQFASLDEAERVLKEEQFTMAIIDQQLDGHKGVEIIEKYLDTHKVKTVLVSGTFVPPKEYPESIAFLQKPFDETDLYRALFTLDLKKEMNLDKLYETYDQNEKAIAKAIQLFITEFSSQLTSFLRAIEQKDVKKFKDTKHRVVTHIKLLELDSLAGLIERIELDMESGKGIEKADISQLRLIFKSCISIFEEVKERKFSGE